VEQILDELQPQRILEIGCGLGGFGARMAARAGYVGVEADLRSSQAARACIDPVGGSVVHGTVDDLGPGKTFDLVCAFEVLEHIDDDQGALGEWAARVAPGGSLLLSVPAGPDRLGKWDESVGHFRRYDGAQLDRLLRACALTEVRHRYYGWPLGFVTEGIRNRVAERRAGRSDPASFQARTAASGRQLQPGRGVGAAIRIAIVPWVAAQRLRPATGVGLVGVGQKPISTPDP